MTASSPGVGASAPASALRALLAPEVLVVVGASRDPRKWGSRVLRYTAGAGFIGRLYAVNPNAAPGTVEGVRYVRRVADIPDAIDCAMIALPRERVPDAVAECAAVGARSAIIPASGFRELGAEGGRIEQALLVVAQAAGMRLLGPNCFGLYRSPAGVNLTPREQVPAGSIGLVTQSGNVAIALFNEARAVQVGFSTCIGVGNQLDIGFGEVLATLAGDPHTKAVGVYVEGLPAADGPSFSAGLGACADAGKPVFVLKAGRSAHGAAAVQTHTGALAADDRVWQAVIETGGSVRVNSTQEMMDCLQVAVRVPRTAGRVLVLTDGGGDSVMATDAIAGSRLSLATLGRATQSRLAALVPPVAPRLLGGNPVTLDTPGGLQDDPLLLVRCADVAAQDPGVDAIVVGGVFGGYREHRAEEMAAVERLARLHADRLPVLVQSAYDAVDEEPILALRAAGIPTLPTIQRLVAALSATVAEPPPPPPPPPPRTSPPSGAHPLSPQEAATLLQACGVQLPTLETVRSPAELAPACAAVGLPACVKLTDPLVVHKSDVRGVILDLADLPAVNRAAGDLWRRFPGSALTLMPMLPPGLELLLGTTSDPVFGPVIIVGRGGVSAESDPDVVVRLAPVTAEQARGAIAQLRLSPLLRGFRGQPALDTGALVDLMVALSHQAAGHRELSIDLNPVFLYPSGYAVADLRVLRQEPHPGGGDRPEGS